MRCFLLVKKGHGFHKYWAGHNDHGVHIDMSDKMRLASTTDAADALNILKIYEPYVQHTAVSFEIETPSLQEFSQRIVNISTQYPYIVYLSNDNIIGYAYASKHRDRAAYCYNVDVSIYIFPEYHGKGIAQNLYTALFSLLKEQGYYYAFAGCTIPNEKTIKFHQKFGFNIIGNYKNVGYKLGEWHDVTWLQKSISEYPDKPDYPDKPKKNPKTPKSINELSSAFIQSILDSGMEHGTMNQSIFPVEFAK